MSIYSTLRAAHYLASDILPALRRFAAPAPDDADPYAERLARARAEALAEREAAEEVSAPIHWTSIRDIPQYEPRVVTVPIRDYQAEADECLCDEDGGLSCDSCSSIADIGAEALAEQLGVESIFRPGEKGCEPPSAADEPAFTTWCAQIDARIAAIQDHLTSAAPGATFTPDAAPESPAPDTGAGAGHPGFPNWCAAEMRQVAGILLTAESPFRVGYANDLRRAADERDDDHGSERVSWPWPDENDRRK